MPRAEWLNSFNTHAQSRGKLNSIDQYSPRARRVGFAGWEENR